MVLHGTTSLSDLVSNSTIGAALVAKCALNYLYVPAQTTAVWREDGSLVMLLGELFLAEEAHILC